MIRMNKIQVPVLAERDLETWKYWKLAHFMHSPIRISLVPIYQVSVISVKWGVKIYRQHKDTEQPNRLPSSFFS